MQHDYFFKDDALPFAEGRHTIESEEHFKPHLHHSFSVGAIETGEVSFQVGKTEVSLYPGCLALVNPDTRHACNAEVSSKRSFYMLHLDKNWCLKIQQSLWQNNVFIPVDCCLAKDLTLYQLYLETMNCLMGNTHLLEKEQRLVHLAEAIFARCCLPTVPVAPSHHSIIELKEWLTKDLQNDVTLESYARKRNVNPYTLLRHFKNTYGITPYAFRMNCRIEFARKLLQQGNDIGDTAQMCGFFDQSHFHRHFKAMTSVTPKQYKENFI